MTLIEFLSLGLKRGQKVTIHFKNTLRLKAVYPLVERAIFTGFRNYDYRETAHDAEDIVPMFNKISKNGKKLNAHIDQPTYLPFIESIDVDNSVPTLGSSDANSILNAVENLQNAAHEQVLAIIKEMGTLYPGKRIILGPDTYEVNADYYLKYGCDSGYIVSVGWDDCDKNAVFALSLSCQSVESATDGDFSVNWLDMLHSLLLAIEYPVTDDEMPGKGFYNPDTDTWKDVRLPDEKDCPVLFGSGCLHALRANMWFETLDTEAKKQKFASLYDDYQKGLIPFEGDMTSAFLKGLDEQWCNMAPDVKCRHLPDKKR